MDDGSIFMIVALIILIGLSAFFSAAETAYNSLNEIRLRSKAEDGDAKQRTRWRWLSATTACSAPF